MPEPELLCVAGLRVSFPRPGKEPVPAVRGACLKVRKGKTLGLVGESGSGKSLTALSILGLAPWPGRIQGSIRFKGRELAGLSEAEYESVRGAQIAVVFQDPAACLNPVLSVGEQLIETVRRHRRVTREEARCAAVKSLARVDIPSPEQRLRDYPHQLSGGMKQRVLIALALSGEPECLLLDEPTTALDVTVQAQLLDLIEQVQRETHMGLLLISHDLSVISEISDEVAVMYAGRIVEIAPTPEILRNPKHPYTRGLLDSIPTLTVGKEHLKTLGGLAPDPADLPSGCPFHPRCPRALDQCRKDDPPLTEDRGRSWACWNEERESR